MMSYQLRMARAALRWNIPTLSARSNVSPATITRFEQGKGVHQRTAMSIRRVLEDAGIEFIVTDAVRIDERLIET